MLTSIIAFLIMIGVLITIHEFGHFLFARLFGVKVEVFSIGFGPPIVRWKGKETEYQIALIPLGGYVKMYGEDSMTEPVQGKVDEKTFNDPRSFHSKPRWQKIMIAFAGPLFNILLAIFLFSAVYMMGIKQPAYLDEPVVVGYVQHDSYAEKAGLKPFDRIVAVGEHPVKNWKEFTMQIGMKAGKKVNLKVIRNGKELIIPVEVPENISKESIGISPLLPPVVDKVLKDSPAEKAGLQPGDTILAINGKPIKTWFEIVDFLSSNKKVDKLALTIKRGNKIFTLVVKPKKDERLNRYVLGITPVIKTETIKYPFFQAVVKGLEKSWELTVAIGEVIKGLITGEVSIKTLGGPIAIAQFSGQALETGISAFLLTVAFISLQLGYLNLLPIPVLDGGLIAILLIESVIGRPLPEKAKEYLAYIGFALIGTLMIFVIFNDILRALS